MSKKSTGKRYKRIRGDLSPEQQRALAEWQRTFQKAHPLMLETQSVARRLWQEVINATEWKIAESHVPEHMKEQVEQPEQWSVGHAKVNYVDHIDIKEDPQ